MKLHFCAQNYGKDIGSTSEDNGCWLVGAAATATSTARDTVIATFHARKKLEGFSAPSFSKF